MEPRFWRSLLACMICMTCRCFAMHIGQEFITAFPQNSDSCLADVKFELTITSFSAQTTVKVSVTNKNYIRILKLNNGESKTLSLPKDIKVVGSGFSDSSVLVTANHDISVIMVSSKTTSTDRTVVLPVDQLDYTYYIVTPGEEPVENLKEFIVVNYNMPAKISIFVKGWVTFDGTNITSTNPLIIALRPFQVFQLQSSRDLSGTKVSSSSLMAVLSGVTCTWRNRHCGHVFEQLKPVSSWGKEYIVAPIPYQFRYDIVYVTASQYTEITYTSSPKNNSIVLHGGDVVTIQIHHNAPLAISANACIQVLYYCTGGVNKNSQFDAFFIALPDTSKFCAKYFVHGLQSVTNAVLITTMTSNVAGIKFNKISLQSINWKPIPMTNYSWALYRYGQQYKPHIVSHLTSTLSVLSVGISQQASYGLSGVCLMRNNLCTGKHCRKMESCHVIEGKPLCIPDSEAICQIWGDSHYQTFDGLSYDFQGTCTYTVSKTCLDPQDGGDNPLPEFTIMAKYNNRGSRASSYIAEVSIHIDEYNITLVQYEFGFARVNNVKWALPIFLDHGSIRIIATGFHALLETHFIRIRYDWDVFLFIKIPSSFFENVGGLCGNYNGNKDGDMETSKGTLVSDVVEFAKSWKVKEDCSSCWDDCYGPCPPFLPEVGTIYKSPEFCGIMSQINGPFHQCHPVVNPDLYVNSCVNDMIRHSGYKKVLCDAITIYLVACQVQEARVEEWRSKVACEMECQGHSWYNPCGDPCPETCAGKLSSCQEQLPCMETCECNPGFVLHEDHCILKSKCGPFCRGYHYSPRETVWGEDGCTEKCWCEAQMVKCSKSQCQNGEECSVRGGIKGCYPTAYSHCSAFGDLHFVTFDGAHFDFHGPCRYQFTGLCDKSRGLTEFSVEIFIRNQGVHNVSFTKSVMVKLHGAEILLSRGTKGRAKLNDVLFNLPISMHDDNVQIFTDGWNGVILTEFGLKVTYDWHSHVTVTLPSSYSGAVCGLCGNFNGNVHDDITMRNGKMSHNVSAFVQSWKSTKNQKGCQEMEPTSCPLIHIMEKVLRKTLLECGIILNDEGPFRGCHDHVNPEEHFQKCLKDVCFYSARQDVYCKVIEAYAAACQAANGTVESWRKNGFCNTWCPQNSSYTLCSREYPKTCSGIQFPHTCNESCRESCVCEDGYVLDVDRCVPISECGCTLNGAYYKVNEEFYPTLTCNERCVCEPGGLVKCLPFACSPYEVCKHRNGVQKCYPTQSALCLVTGGSLYRTFDGVSYNFRGNCNYVLSKSCFQNSSSPESFSISMSMTDPQAITIYVKDVKISLLQGKYGTVEVNDILYNLPLDQQDKGFWIHQRGIGVMLGTNFGLQVTYDLASQVILNISSSFHGKVCGLCGNYNRDTTDDFRCPNGSLEVNATAFGESWKDSSLDSPCQSKCQGDFCSPCQQKSFYEGKKYCGMLLIRGGPFSACHYHVDPLGYFGNCAQNLCQALGNKNVLCNSLQSYVTVCQSIGIASMNWRSSVVCPLDCPQNSHYEACTDTCSTTCVRVVDPTPCHQGCSEGCQCNDDYYLDGDRCVPLSQCGCYIEGRYYTVNGTFLVDDCKQICTCGLGSTVTCQTHTCLGECRRKSDRTFACRASTEKVSTKY